LSLPRKTIVCAISSGVAARRAGIVERKLAFFGIAGEAVEHFGG
jgi:hypothetical protein